MTETPPNADLVGVVLAGGLGTRLLPLTRNTNKHLLSVAGRPMIDHTIDALVAAGVREIVVVTAADAVSAFRSALDKHPAASTIRVVAQPAPAGIADALARAEPSVGERPMVVLLGDNFFGGGIARHVDAFRAEPTPARLVLWQPDTQTESSIASPSPFGHATLDAQNRIIRVIEKPEVPESPWVVTGLYMYAPGVFERCRSLEPSGRGELEISDLNDAYARAGEAACSIHAGWWADAGTPADLAHVDALLRRREPTP